MANNYESLKTDGHYTLAYRIFLKIKSWVESKVQTDVPTNAVFTDTLPTAYCDSAANATAKVAQCTGFSLKDNSYIPINFTNGNTVTKNTGVTLNINNTGAKPLYVNWIWDNSIPTDSPFNAGTYIIYYVNNEYYLYTSGTLYPYRNVAQQSDLKYYSFSSQDGSVVITEGSGTIGGPTTYTEDLSVPLATTVSNGLLSAADKIKIDDFEDTKVTQTELSADEVREILIAGTSTTATITTGAAKSVGLRIHPNAKAIMEGDNTLATTFSSHAEGAGSTASGMYSHAEGYYTRANGQGTHVEGYQNFSTTATAYGGHAEGFCTTINSGPGAHAEGFHTYADGLGSHAEGYYTTAKGNFPHAEGNYVYASGDGSHAEGYKTTAKAYQSHAEGNYTYANNNFTHVEGNYSTGNGYYSHSEGDHSISSGVASHTEGCYTNATTTGAHAEGYGTSAKYNVAGGVGSHAEGFGTSATGLYAHAEGENTKAAGLDTHAEGYGTYAYGSYTHAEGNRTTATDSYSHAEGIYTYAGNGSHAEGQSTTAGYYGHAEGEYTYASGDGSHAEGYQSYAKGTAAHAEGYKTTALYKAHAEGQESYASGTGSHVEGYKTTAYGEDTHAEGSNTYANGSAAHAEGGQTRANQMCTHAEGYGTTANYSYGHAEGLYTYVGGSSGAHAEGNYTTANGGSSHAEGRYTLTNALDSHAEGYYSRATGDSAHAENNHTYAKGNYSHTEGSYTTATHQSQHVFGEYNDLDASTATSTNRGTYVEIVGNGLSSTQLSNARTLDWDGNEKIAGNLTDKWGLQTSRDLFQSEFDDLTQEERDNGTTYYIKDGEPLRICDYIYPVGAIYMSVNNISPAILFGGTWERIKDRFLLAAGDDYTAGSTGGEAEHTHTYGIQMGGCYYDTTWEGDANSGLMTYDSSNNATLKTDKTNIITAAATVNGGNTASSTSKNLNHYRTTANVSYTSNMPPYLTVYMWKRVPDPEPEEENNEEQGE